MISNCDRLESVMEALGRGFIEIDRDNRIRKINDSALSMIGISIDTNLKHPSGAIKQGDVVIIVDNDMGNDDGNLTNEDLKLININNKDIKMGDSIIAVGSYMSKEKPIYKYFRKHQTVPNINLGCSFHGHKIRAELSFTTRKMTIVVDDIEYVLGYQNSVGHMVIIDGKTGCIRFVQVKGYSVRKEAVNDILHGHKVLAKPINTEYAKNAIIGKRYLDLFDKAELSDLLDEVMNGKTDKIREELYEINKRIFLCDVLPYYEINQDGKENKEYIKGVHIVLQSSADLENLIDNRNQILEAIEANFRKEVIKYSGGEYKESKFIGNSVQAEEVRYLAHKAAHNKCNVLLTGESGTGKSMLAKEIHNLSGQEGPYVEVHCNAIANTLFESELFGYVGGAFTGASTAGKVGYFEIANGGTIFLDEIGEIPPEIQVKLLQVLQEKVIYRVGSSKPIKINVRVIVATNKDLKEEVRVKNFRQDLFYRINIFPIDIPPLRSRKSDILALSNILLNRVCSEYELPQKKFSSEAVHKIISYTWPGNVRELENCIERAVVLCESNLIYPEHLNIVGNDSEVSLARLLESEEERIIKSYLDKNDGDKLAAAKELKVSKSTFYNKLKKLGIE